jgi:bacterioferritin (cytochrome b1)
MLLSGTLNMEIQDCYSGKNDTVMKGNEKALDVLNPLLADAWATTDAYRLHSGMYKNRDKDRLRMAVRQQAMNKCTMQNR